MWELYHAEVGDVRDVRHLRGEQRLLVTTSAIPRAGGGMVSCYPLFFLEMDMAFVTSLIPSAIDASPNDVHGPSSDTAAVVTYAAAAGFSHHITGLVWSYSGGTPSGGNLRVTDGDSVVFNMDITAAGAGFVPFTPAKRGTTGSSMTITLAAGGTGVSGKVSVPAHWQA